MKPYDYLKTSTQFDEWLDGLKSPATQARITGRAVRARETGHLGDHHGVKGADGIGEMRLDFGPGYRLYYTAWEYRGRALLLLLGGDKSTQRRDIRKAKAILAEARARAEREIDEEIRKREEEGHGT